MKRFSKILKITGIVILVLIAFLAAAPFLFKGKIIDAVKKTANQSLNATLDFDNGIHLNFFRNFPNVSVGIEKMSVLGKDSFAGDTLVYFPDLRLTLDIMSVLSGDQISIKKAYLKDPYINILTLASGSANWDIIVSDTTAPADSTSGTFKLGLNSFEIENGHLVYDDKSLGFYTELFHFNHESKGDFTSDRFKLATHTETPSLILGYGGINWLYKIKTSADADIQMDMNQFVFAYQKGKVKLNDLEIESDGMVDLNDSDITMDIVFKALQNDFKSFLSLVPGMYSNSFKDVQASGLLALSGSLTGKMTDDKMPETKIDLLIKNGAFKYPTLAYNADNIFLDLKYRNTDGDPDHSVVDINRFLARIAGQEINMNLLLKTPVSDPFIDGSLKGQVDLSRIAGLIPLEKGTQLAGQINADLAAKGNYSNANSKNLSKLDAKGWLKIANFIFKTPQDKEPYKIDNLDLNFTPKDIAVNQCSGTIGKNDFQINGTVNNLLGYMFASEKLTGNVNFKSNYFNVNSLMTESAPDNPTPADTGKLSVVELPSNLDVKLNADIGKLIYDTYILTNMKGTCHLHDAQLDMNELNADILGGNVSLNGTYDSKNIKNPFTSLDTKIQHLNIGESFSYFPMLAKFAPIANYVNGLFNADISMNSILDEKMQPNYSSMNVNATVSFTDAIVSNLDILRQVGKQLNVSWLENLQLKNQKLRFQIREGVFSLLDSILLPLGKGATMKLSGQSKLDQTINYGGWIKIPREAMGNANSVLQNWTQLAGTKGWNLALAKEIPVDLSVKGTFKNPDVKVSLKGFAQSTVSTLKENAKEKLTEEANKKREEALNKAREQADKVMQEGQKKAEQLRNESHVAAEKIRSEARNSAEQLRQQGNATYDRMMAETEKAAQQAEARVSVPSLAKAAGDKVRNEGRKKAEASRAEFETRAAKLESEADKRATQMEEETNHKAEAIERAAQEEADRIMKEADEKSKI